MCLSVQLLVYLTQLMQRGHLVLPPLSSVYHPYKQKLHNLLPVPHTLFHNKQGMQHNGNLHAAYIIASIVPYASHLNGLCIIIVHVICKKGITVSESIHH